MNWTRTPPSTWLLWLGIWVAACTDAPVQVLVDIDADDQVARNLTSLEVKIYGTAADERGNFPEVDSQELILGETKVSTGTATIPFSFGVLRGKEERFLLVVLGRAGGQPVIEKKAMVSFLDDRIRHVGIYLATPCYGVLCGDINSNDWLSVTCNPDQDGACEAPPENPPSKTDEDATDAGADVDTGSGDAQAPMDADADAPSDAAPRDDASETAMDAPMDGSEDAPSMLPSDATNCPDGALAPCSCESGFEADGDGGCRNTDDCPGHMCQHSSRCMDGISAYTCDCTSTGYEGRLCENNVDDCAGNLCQHGSTCRDGLKAYTCDCGTSGYEGDYCQTDFNECTASSMCTHPDYPCKQTAPPGYTCDGQFADWPMPDAVAGAAHAPSYDVQSIPGVVRDGVTGLMWQRDLPAAFAGCTGTLPASAGHPNPQFGDCCSWEEAKSYCAGLVWAGFDDWRLPTKIQLESIVDETKFDPAIDTGVFLGTISIAFWSASSSSLTSGSAWLVPFFNGSSIDLTTSGLYPVRCVRGTPASGAAPAARYVRDDSNNRVTDTRTGLIWEGSVSAPGRTWSASASYCAGLGSGWRLPTLKELLTVVDPTRTNPSISPVFLNAPAGPLWSSSPYINAAGNSWIVFFDRGATSAGPNTEVVRSLCVR